MTTDINKKVKIKNMCTWDLLFSRHNGIGDIKVPANKFELITVEEIQSQVQLENKMFTGTDGQGSNARIYIDDEETRVLMGFDSEDGKTKQIVLTEDEIKRILGLKTLSSFKENIENKVVTEPQKKLFIEIAKQVKLNDFDKIKFVEEYTELSFN